MGITLILQIVMAVLAALLILPPLVKKGLAWYNKPEETLVPEKTLEVDSVTINNDDEDFADIVEVWENFLDVLIRNDMPKCAEKTKNLLSSMADEYRSDILPVPKEPEVAILDSVLVDDED